jgi:polysaccharide biosynthesis transport protein
VGLRDYLNVIRKRLWLIILAMVVVAAVFLAVSLVQAPTYRGEAEVIVSGQNTGAILLGAPRDQGSIQADQADVQTQVRVIQSRRLAEQVVATLRLSATPDNLLQRLTTSTDGQSNIVTIDVLDASAAGAADIANAFAEAYVTWSRESRQASIKAAADDVEQRLLLAQQQIETLASTAGPATTEQQVKLQAARVLYASLADKLEQLRVNQQLEVGSGSVLTSAVVDPAPVSPRPVRDGELGLTVGLAMGLGMVFLAEQLDTRIRTSEEAAQIYGAPVLGAIPVEKFDDGEASRLTVVQHPGGSAAEAYRGLRISMDFVNFEHRVRTVLITSAVPSEGKSTVAANLAVALAQAGRTVVLLSCDFHRSATAKFFDLKGSIGLSDVLTGAHGIAEALQQPDGFERLSVVTVGQVPPNPGELLGSSRMELLVASLRESVDWVIVDAPPVLAVADAAALARLSDAVVMVARIGLSKRDDARAARGQLENIGARILGIVVWGLKKDSAAARIYSGYTSR